MKWNIEHVGDDSYIVVNQDAKLPTLIRLSEYRGQTRVDARQIWSPNDNEQFVLTKKGAAFPIEDLDEVIEFLLALRELK